MPWCDNPECAGNCDTCFLAEIKQILIENFECEMDGKSYEGAATEILQLFKDKK